MKFFQCLLDDLNTPKYFAKLHELYNVASKGDKNKRIEFNEACRFIGIFNQKKDVLAKKKQDYLKLTKNIFYKK